MHAQTYFRSAWKRNNVQEPRYLTGIQLYILAINWLSNLVVVIQKTLGKQWIYHLNAHQFDSGWPFCKIINLHRKKTSYLQLLVVTINQLSRKLSSQRKLRHRPRMAHAFSPVQVFSRNCMGFISCEQERTQVFSFHLWREAKVITVRDLLALLDLYTAKSTRRTPFHEPKWIVAPKAPVYDSA